uniref:Uncharacterized protein n=1 Tax=Arundo donax TaxID=35708 RepID=A0A0A9FJU2_ARUDO
METNSLIPKIQSFPYKKKSPQAQIRHQFDQMEAKFKSTPTSGPPEPIETPNIRTKSIPPIKQNTACSTEAPNSRRQRQERRRPTSGSVQSPNLQKTSVYSTPQNHWTGRSEVEAGAGERAGKPGDKDRRSEEAGGGIEGDWDTHHRGGGQGGS